jgi:hypothetical protein
MRKRSRTARSPGLARYEPADPLCRTTGHPDQARPAPSPRVRDKDESVHPVEPAATDPVECLVVVDMQAGFVTGAHALPGADGLVAAVDSLLTRARAAGTLVIHLRNAGGVGAPDEPGTPTWELHHRPTSNELVSTRPMTTGSSTPLLRTTSNDIASTE